MGFNEFMAERKEVNRWLILLIGLIGMFCGAVLAFITFLLGFIKA